jgi:PHP family Zn ribbon phosphoesterase
VSARFSKDGWEGIVTEPACVKCGDEYYLPDGYEATDYCNPCAQELVSEMLAELEYQRDRNYNSFEPDNQSDSYKRLDAVIRKARGEGIMTEPATRTPQRNI